MRSKRGVIWPYLLSIIILSVVIIIILLIFPKQIANFIKGINSCEAKGGECSSSCIDSMDRIPAGDADCAKEFKNQNSRCCRVDRKAEEELRGYGAHSDLIKVLIDKQKTPLYYGERRDLEIRDTPYKIETVLDYKKIRDLADTENPRCSLFLKDMNTGEEFVLIWSQTDLSEDTTKPYNLTPSTYTFNNKNSFVVSCSGLNKADELQPRYFKPTVLQAGRIYELRIIVYDKDVTEYLPRGQKKDFSDEWEIKDAILDEENWVVEFTASFRVKPIIEIKDISTTWVAADDITIRANEPYKLFKVWVKIVNDVNFDKQKSVYQNLQEACEKSTRWYDRLHKITSLKVGEEGVNLGLFAAGKDAYATIAYESKEEPIAIKDNQAQIHLDAAAIAKTFDAAWLINEYESEELIEHYMCVKAQVVTPGGTSRTITTYSEQPLRVDVAPPLIDNTDKYISVVYPDPRLLENNLPILLNQGRVTPGQQVTPFYFEEYPKVVIKKCFDKSGCKNYDYYFAPTYIRINIHATDIETGIVSMILGEGLNYLYNYLVTRNPLKTVCPLANSGQYRYNTHPEIRSRRGEQGVFCIRVSDDVGNYWLTWKVVYNPYDVIEDVVQEAAT